MASNSRANAARTSQAVRSATMYYQTLSSAKWIRLTEAYHRDYQGNNERVIEGTDELTEPPNVENVLFNGGIQIEQAAAKYNKFFTNRHQNRWRIRFEDDQYGSVLVKEEPRPHADSKAPDLIFIEVVFDILAAPTPNDVSVAPVAPKPKKVSGHDSPAKRNAEVEAGNEDIAVELGQDTPADELPLARLLDNAEEQITKIRLVFLRPKGKKGNQQWSWPATARFLQGHSSYQKPPSLTLDTWNLILNGSLQQFMSSGLGLPGTTAEEGQPGPALAAAPRVPPSTTPPPPSSALSPGSRQDEAQLVLSPAHLSPDGGVPLPKEAEKGKGKGKKRVLDEDLEDDGESGDARSGRAEGRRQDQRRVEYEIEQLMLDEQDASGERLEDIRGLLRRHRRELQKF
ncbi:MAG: hypothetical protein Q9210_007076 [Variospora velana]